MSHPQRAAKQTEQHQDFDRYLAEKAALVERFLEDYLPGEETHPESISRAVRYSLFAGGKRMRPVLVLAGAEAVGGSEQEALPAAAAFEMIHTYSLIHDDLPAMDGDSLRRGKPTSHIVFGEALAILAGDALLTYAFQLLAERPDGARLTAERQVRAMSIIARAAGVNGMIGGQVADVESEGRPVGADTLEYIHRHKTGALIRAAAEAGALVGGGSEEQIQAVARYGENIGLAFQVVDDILDIEETSETLGKSAGKDERAGKATYPQIYGIAEARLEAERLTREALRHIEPFGERGWPLSALARRILERRS